MSKQGDDHEIASSSKQAEERKESQTSEEYLASRRPISDPRQEQLSAQSTSSLSQYSTPHPPLRVKRPGRPRIHPPKPVGISKPRGRPRGSKNKKPRKRRDTGIKIVERPPKRPRGRPRIWPPEMWEGFQRSQFATVSSQIQQHIRREQAPPEEMPGTSQMYYEEQIPESLPHHEELLPSGPPPLSHLPFHISPSQQQQQVPQQGPPLHHSLHHQLHRQQQEQMHILQPLYLQDPEQQQQQQQQQEEHVQISVPAEEQHPYFQEPFPPLLPPHTTS